MATTDTNVPQVIVNKLTQAQYNAAVKDPTEFYAVTDGQIGTADIADGAVTAAKIATSTYSTTEQVVGTWIDGKPLYRKVYTGTITPSSSSFAGIDIAGDVDTLVSCNGSVDATNNQFMLPWVNRNSSDNTLSEVFRVFTEKTTHTVKLQAWSTSLSSQCGVHACLEYTKTTD